MARNDQAEVESLKREVDYLDAQNTSNAATSTVRRLRRRRTVSPSDSNEQKKQSDLGPL